MSADSRDRTQIGLPDSTDEMLKELVSDTPWFAAEMDAYRVAITLALAKGLEPKAGESDTGYSTKFHATGLDPDGKLKQLVTTFAPEHADMPYRWAMHLANKGVMCLHSALIDKGLSLTEALGLTMRED